MNRDQKNEVFDDFSDLERTRNEYEHLMKTPVHWPEIFEKRKTTEEEAKRISSENWESHAKHLSTLTRTELESLAMCFLADLHAARWRIDGLQRVGTLQIKSREAIRDVYSQSRRAASRRAKKAADVRHDAPGSSREKSSAIKAAWATGKYASRDICAEQECAALSMSFSSARKALRNTPDPSAT